jgi:uncharacterized protein YbjT (DUF2867 family)
VVERLTARCTPPACSHRLAVGRARFDWEDRSTWNPVLEGVGSVYVSHYWDAIPGAAETLGGFAELAVESGVPRLVLLAGRGEEEAELAERAVGDSGAELTVLRSTCFAQNFSEGYWREQVQSNEVALPPGGMPEPFRRARAAGTRLTSGGSGFATWPPGPRARPSWGPGCWLWATSSAPRRCSTSQRVGRWCSQRLLISFS